MKFTDFHSKSKYWHVFQNVPCLGYLRLRVPEERTTRYRIAVKLDESPAEDTLFSSLPADGS